jgi:hypothetical protein
VANRVLLTARSRSLWRLTNGGGYPIPINNTSYPVNHVNIITCLSVGDQFWFLGDLTADGSGNDHVMTVSLSVQPVPGPGFTIPEPSSPVLMVTGLLPMLIVWWLRRR